MARTKKVSKKAGTKKFGKKSASGTQLKHVAGNHAKVRHMRDRRGHLHVFDGRLPTGLVAKPILAQPKSKHRSYFEFVENTEKKKKLEFTVVNPQSRIASCRTPSHPFIGHQEDRAAARLRVRSYREPCTDCGMQGTVERTRSHGLHCFGLLC
jgi:hypothetical protein